jgi:large subunit ribosomal protein L22
MEAIAKRKNLKGSPRKTRLVIDLIRGRNVSQALAILKFTNKRAADPITKLLRSAIANATYLAEQKNIAIDPDDLWVKSCFVDMGMHKNRRRLRPAPQGRAYQEQRHYCHITILVSSDKPESPVVKLKKHGNKVDAEAVELKEANAAKKKSEAKPKKSDKKADKPEAKETKAEKSEEVVEVEKPVVDLPEVETSTAEEAKTDAKPVEETVVDETAEVAPVEETVETEQPFDNKPPAAQTEEEKTGSKMAEDAQIDRNEELERQ